MRLGIIGAGRAAWAFGRSWQQAGLELSGLTLRPGSGEPNRMAGLLAVPVRTLDQLLLDSDIVLVAVQDRWLPEVAARAAAAPGHVSLFHPSGSLTSELFAPHPRRFSLHPLQALPEMGGPTNLRGTLLVFEGNEAVRELATTIVENVGGRFGQIRPEEKMRYHAAAVLASNHVAALLEMSTTLMEQAGLPADSIRRDLAALSRSAIEVWLDGSGTTRFTGPAARGDDALTASHLTALRDRKEIATIYEKIGGELSRIVAAARKGPA